MRRHAFLSLIPAALLALAGCTEHESPTGIAAPVAVSQQLLLAPANSLGRIVAWGRGDEGQLGVPPGNNFIAVAGGVSHATALRTDGSLISWGSDKDGQVSGTPTGNDFVAVAGGGFHGVALREDGSLVAWGWDQHGQVSNTPAEFDFVAVTANVYHSVALRADGSLVSWGDDSFGLISDTPTGTEFVAVAAGEQHSTALRSNGSLVSWGNNTDFSPGQVRDTPTGHDFVAVAAGVFHGTALRSDGSLVHWGGLYRESPTGNDFVAIAAGYNYSIALRNDGSLVSWGGNNIGGVLSDTPSGNDFVGISAGPSTGYAIQLSPDELAPAISITSPSDGAVYLLGQVVLADYACTDEDGGSGLASCTGSVANGETINTAQVGAKTFVVDAADEAGNTATLTHAYTVAYDFSGFGAPVQDDGTLNAVKAGRTVPLVWRLADASGQPITDLSGVNVTVEDIACELGGTADVLEESASGASGLQNLGDGYYQFNWKTPRSYASSCKTLHLDLGEGLTRTAMFRFTK